MYPITGKHSRLPQGSSVFKDNAVQEHLSSMGVEWKFNLEKAPWWGGIFERMVKSTKCCLRKMMGQAKLTLDELDTLWKLNRSPIQGLCHT